MSASDWTLSFVKWYELEENNDDTEFNDVIDIASHAGFTYCQSGSSRLLTVEQLSVVCCIN